MVSSSTLALSRTSLPIASTPSRRGASSESLRFPDHDRASRLRPACDRLSELHVGYARLEVRQPDRRTRADRINEVRLDLPAAGLLRRDRDLLQLRRRLRLLTIHAPDAIGAEVVVQYPLAAEQTHA